MASSAEACDGPPAAKRLRIDCYAAMAAGEALRPWAYEVDQMPGNGEVDLEISHCGVCHSDVHQLDDAWGVACWPLVAGHEIVGRVVAVGSGVSNFQIGDLAAIGVQRGHCGSCSSCSAGLENLCPKILKTYAGPGKDKGGFAKRIRYPSSWVFKCPADLAPEHAAPLMCAGITVYSPLKRFVLGNDPCGSGSGKKVGIIGIGGLGHLALQFAARMGAEVVAISRSSSKAEEARSFGAGSFLESGDAAAVAAARGSFDVLLNTVSGNADLDEYLALLKPRGAMACVGLPEKDEKSKLFLHSFVLQERSLCGSYLGPYADYEEMLQFACEHGIKPMVELYPIGQVNEAVARIKENKARYRCVLLLDDDTPGKAARM